MKHTLVFHMIGLSKKFRRVIGLNSKSAPLSYSQAAALLIIDSVPFANQTEIARRLHLQPATIVTLIDELEKHRYVKRNITKHDRRTYQISLTSEGKNELASIKKHSAKIERFVKNQLSGTEFKQLTSIVNKLSSSLDVRENGTKSTQRGGERWTTQH